MDNVNRDREVQLYLLSEPKKLRATAVEGKEFYFPCSECEACEPEIAGYLALGPRYEDILVRQRGGESYLAFLCRACTSKYIGPESDSRESERRAREPGCDN